MRMRPEQEDKLFDPRCCTYKLSGETRDHVAGLIDSEDVEDATKAKLREIMEEDEANKSTLGYESLSNLHKYMQRADPNFSETPFYIFRDSCKCLQPKPRSNELLEQRLQRLRLRDSQSWYKRAAVDVDKSIENKLSQSGESSTNLSGTTNELRQFDGSLVAVFNSFLVYICTFIFCYKALEYALEEPNIIGQVLFGLFGSTIVAVAELYLLARVI